VRVNILRHINRDPRGRINDLVFVTSRFSTAITLRRLSTMCHNPGIAIMTVLRSRAIKFAQRLSVLDFLGLVSRINPVSNVSK
jgi:hypothetical protein